MIAGVCVQVKLYSSNYQTDTIVVFI